MPPRPESGLRRRRRVYVADRMRVKKFSPVAFLCFTFAPYFTRGRSHDEFMYVRGRQGSKIPKCEWEEWSQHITSMTLEKVRHSVKGSPPTKDRACSYFSEAIELPFAVYLYCM